MSKRKTTEEFIEEAKKVHGDKYDYSKVEYILSTVKVPIVCRKHGVFYQTPQAHRAGHGCSKCMADKLSKLNRKNLDTFIQEANLVHNNIYDYSKFIYTTNDTKSTIICKIHGEFEQRPSCHLSGKGCPKCKGEKISNKLRGTTKSFIEKAKTIHGDKYDYSKVNYINWYESVEIICKNHGSFFQPAGNHLGGSGCPKCLLKAQTLLFERLKDIFPEEELIWEYKAEWLGKQRIDMCFEKYKIAIEYDGRQHYEPVEQMGGIDAFKIVTQRDSLKNKKCIDNNFTLFRMKYNYTKKDFDDLCIKIKEIILNYNT